MKRFMPCTGRTRTRSGCSASLAEWGEEQAFIRSDLVTRDSIIFNEYITVYPTLHLAYKFSEAAELQLNYSRRVNRPIVHSTFLAVAPRDRTSTTH